ncbi:class I SAM-dependent methyltransferase [Bradyrhizobium commune]|uniref:Class I SAM-dependent methyltransferase n=1 Tax=Bradyrhizobium commune TaxID=83627 RepID=A0A7S9H1P5_9BRAD|nr:class I SAM-dependent methyltransferase [Bradyrhizobium commune]QPF93868.1 class I SAM-dependent methyltransferase [Bradyrhizobium commune]
MRTAIDFDAHYSSPDPWGLKHAGRRDRALGKVITPYVDGRSVLELGCGEGHLTSTIFSRAKSVKGIDISAIAVSRAQALDLPSASFEVSDFLTVSFAGYDVIAAIECLYYLSAAEQDAFLQKLVREHDGVFILSAPIIGANEHRSYYTHSGIVQMLARHGLSILQWRNLNAYWRAGIGGIAAAAMIRLPFGEALIPHLPEALVYQRCYVARRTGNT